jgi:hypothetical protein
MGHLLIDERIRWSGRSKQEGSMESHTEQRRCENVYKSGITHSGSCLAYWMCCDCDMNPEVARRDKVRGTSFAKTIRHHPRPA